MVSDDAWIQLTSRLDRARVWVNMAAATLVTPDGTGSKITLQGRDKELFVTESPDAVMAKRTFLAMKAGPPAIGDSRP